MITSEQIKKLNAPVRVLAPLANVSEATIRGWIQGHRPNKKSLAAAERLQAVVDTLGKYGSLGGYIRARAFVENHSPKKLADLLEVKPSSVEAWMRDEYAPEGRNVRRLFQVLPFEVLQSQPAPVQPMREIEVFEEDHTGADGDDRVLV